MLDELPLQRELPPDTPPSRNVPSASQRVFVGLLIASGLQLVTVLGVFLFSQGEEYAAARNLIATWVFGIGMAYALLAITARRFPLFAAATALFIFLASNVVLARIVPLTHGFIIKLATVLILLRSLLSALEERSRR